MSEKIEAGDLVWIARGHSCAVNQLGGIPMRVESVMHSYPYSFYCSECRAMPVHGPGEYAELGRFQIPLSWLKKFLPPAADESVEASDEVTA